VGGPVNAVILRFNPLVHSSVMFRRDRILRYGGYDERVPYAQDYDLWLRLARVGETLWNLDEPLVVRSMSGSNIAARRERDQIRAELRIRVRDIVDRRHRSMPISGHVRPLLRRGLGLLLPLPVKRTIRRLQAKAP
jgi:hypothetical protein